MYSLLRDPQILKEVKKNPQFKDNSGKSCDLKTSSLGLKVTFSLWEHEGVCPCFAVELLSTNMGWGWRRGEYKGGMRRFSLFFPLFSQLY